MANNTQANKLRRLEKHLKKHPKDKQSKEVLDRGTFSTRKAPKDKDGWISSTLKGLPHLKDKLNPLKGSEYLKKYVQNYKTSDKIKNSLGAKSFKGKPKDENKDTNNK